MREIRDDLCSTSVRRVRYSRTLESSALLPELSRLEGLVESVRLGATHVGTMPPVPQTLRGGLGAKLVSVVRRGLFWYTPQLHSFHLKVAAALNAQASATQALVEDLREVHVQIAELKRQVGMLTQSTPADASLEPMTFKESGWRN